MANKKKNIRKTFLHLLSILFFMIVLCRANVLNLIKPFGYGLGFALVFCNIYPIFTTIFMFFALFLQNLSMTGLICAASTSVVLILYYIASKISKSKKIYILLVFCVVSRAANLYFSFTTLHGILCACTDIVVGTTFCYAYSKVVFATQSKGVQAFTRFEKCLSHFAVFAVFCGLTQICVQNIDFSKFIYLFVVMFLACSFKQKAVSYVLVAVFANFVSTLSGSNTVLYLLSLAIILSGLSQNKFIHAGLVCLVDAIIVAIYGSPLEIIPTILSVILYVAIPAVWGKKLGEYVLGAHKNIIPNYIAEFRQNAIKNRLMTMSIMFDEMQQCYKDIVLSAANCQQTTEFLTGEIKNKMCSNCINKLSCYNNRDMSQPICQLLETAIKKGSANLIDVPNLLASSCNRLGGMLIFANSLAEEYVASSKKLQQDAENKLGVSLQYSGTSTIFKELCSQFAESCFANSKKSNAIKDMLAKYGIVCKECISLESNNGVAQIVMALRTIDCVRQEILFACKKVYNLDFEKQDYMLTKYAGWSIMCLAPKENYELLCGIATTAKTNGEENGDNYIFTKIDNGKYVFAISDGMGHGQKANKLSETSIRLIESFYKCGFDSRLVADSLNNLLLPISSGYTTLDVSIVDTFSGQTDFVKLGSSVSVVKQTEQSYIVGAESLPVGSVEVAKPTFLTTRLFNGNVVVMATDGVVDAFGTENFCNYINNENIINMQFFAEEILQEAASRAKIHKDDMTVVAYKISQKR